MVKTNSKSKAVKPAKATGKKANVTATGKGAAKNSVKSTAKGPKTTSVKKPSSAKAPKASQEEVFTLTENAIKHIQRLSKELDKIGHGLKVEVIPGGCSGYKYFMDFEEAPGETDIVMDMGDVKIFVHKDSVEMLSGTELDYVDSFQGAGFQFNNPNVKSKCGCGKSFC